MKDVAVNKDNTIPSSTAFYKLDGLIRGLEGEYQDIYDDDYVAFSRQMREAVLKKYDNLSQWMGFTLFSSMPNKPYQWLINSQTGLDYYRHMVARSLLIRNKVSDAIANGVEQVVWLGSAFEIGPYILAEENPDCMFYEINSKATVQIKEEALVELKGEEVPSNLFQVGHDYNQGKLFSSLKDKNVNNSKKTLIIAEGITIYLTKDVINNLLNEIKMSFEPVNIELLISFCCSNPDLGEGGIDKGVREDSGEVYRFRLSSNEIVDFLAESEYQVSQKMLHCDMHKKLSHDGVADESTNQENYVLIHPTEIDLQNKLAMEDIPDMPELDTVAASRCEPPSRSCTIL